MPTYTTLLSNNSLIDPTVSSSWPSDSYKEFAQIARRCIEEEPNARPSMPELAKKLKALTNGQQRQCIICMENPPNAKLQCGHAVLCEPCAKYLLRRGEGCPMCRAPVVSLQVGSFSRTFVPFSF